MQENQIDDAIATVRCTDVVSEHGKRRLIDRIEAIRDIHCLKVERCTACPAAEPCAHRLLMALGS
ncbi:hypothetical protein [Azospirillum sp. SYSU D00513]|uniref:hypothetical protein n=1 Tax=Azospirillum sp. SYSU D00513 TaxID=2812561 RepID=UPI001A97804D|nr:hypothetical protein [Azospirillum sp. SYSU D00513]